MDIKNIITFRDFYKSNVKCTNDTNRNPHFAGRERVIEDNETEFGFFEMFHGPNGEMQNLLKTILEMARDSQALYEFMQNAVDAESADFIMFHHLDEKTQQNYLIVLNNGNAFTLAGVLSILDIGASTKFGDAETIGQFGVGFKLAHRLVGEDAGLEELLKQNMGPILFSWESDELALLANNEEVLTLVDPKLSGKRTNAICESKAPWLFKILYTNFPCLPGEQIIDAGDNEITTAFSIDELQILKDVARVCVEKTKALNFKNGSLLAIPLHEKKLTEITQHANADGLPLAAAILSNRKGHKALERVMLNDDLLESAAVEVLSFRFRIDELRTIASSDDQKLLAGIPTIEIDFCFTNPFNGSGPFKNRPQFYLYFPMTEERHGFEFALHCNAFSFTSARTALQDNTERNRLLFRLFTDRLGENLKQFSESDKEKFINIYASLVLSQRGQNNEEWKSNREWLEDDLWKPLMKVIKAHIPVKNNESWTLAGADQTVFIKNSNLPLEEWYIREKAEWFFWNMRAHEQLCTLAKEKLKLPQQNLINVIEDSSALLKINEWLSESAENTQLFLEEMEWLLQQPDIFKEKKEAEEKAFWQEHFAQLKLWWFQGKCYTANELSADKADTKVIRYGAISALENHLSKTRIILSDAALDDFPTLLKKLRDRYQSLLPYINEIKILIEKLNPFLDEPGLFSVSEKESIFNILHQFVGTDDKEKRIDRLSILRLFANKREPSEIKALSSIIGAAKVPQMLQAWRIREDESRNLKLDEYLVQTGEQIYMQVIVPFWKDIATQESTVSERVELFEYIAGIYKPEMQGLPLEYLFFTENGLIPQNTPSFFHSTLADVPDDYYKYLASAAGKSGIGYLPQQSLLAYYKKPPFRLDNAPKPNLTVDNETLVFTFQEMRVLLYFYNELSGDFFDHYCIRENENGCILMDSSVYKNYSANSSTLVQYIKEYHDDALLLLSPKLHTEQLNILKEKTLFAFLIEKLNTENLIATIALIELLTDAPIEGKIMFIQQQTPFNIEDEIKENGLHHKLLQLCFSISKENRDIILDDLVYLLKDGAPMKLSQLSERGSDELKIPDGEQEQYFSIAELLGGAENIINNQLTVAARQWQQLGIASIETVEHALGIHQHREPHEVFNKLCIHCDYTVQNGTQLVFVLLYAALNERAVEGLSINTMDGVKKLAGATYYLYSDQNRKTLPEGMILAECYNAVQTHLPQKKRTFAKETIICTKPYINIVTYDLILPGVDHIEASKQNEFFIYLYELWQQVNKPVRIMLPVPITQFIGFDIESWILEEDLALVTEMVPYSSLPFEKKEDTCLFLSALGASNRNSTICQARIHFLESKSEPFQYQLSKKQAKACLFWLAEKQLKVRPADLVSFYNHWQQLNEDEMLPPLIGIFPRSEEFFIIDHYSEAYYISSNDLKHLRDIGLRMVTISSIINKKIVAPIDCLKVIEPQLQQVLSPLPIQWAGINWARLRAAAHEWQSEVYESWKKPQDNSPKIMLYPGYIPKQDLIFEHVIREFYEGNVAYDQSANTYFINSLLREDELVNELARAYPANADWEQLKQLLAAEIQEMQRLLALARQRPATSELINRFVDNIRITEERQEKARLVNDPDSRYTVLWFQHLLDLVRTQEQKTSIPDIVFLQCTPSPEGQAVYQLSNTNGHIPSNIETFENINTEIHYRNEQHEIKSHTTYIQASYRYRQLKVIFPKGFPKEIDPSKIELVKLTFDRTLNLIEALKAGYRRLNLADDTNLKTTLTPHIHFVFGPPGTGKTTTLANRIIEKMESEHSGPVIVLTPTNKAADVLVKKIIEQYKSVPMWLVRTGTCTDAEIIAAGIVQHNDELVINAASHKIIITTIHRFAYHKVRTSENNIDQLSLCDCPWSQVIFDEASMIPLAYIAFAIHVRQLAAPDTSFIVAGDPLQIPPVFDLVAEDLDEAEQLQLENIYTMVGLNSFDESEQQQIPVYGVNNCIENLNVQHRSIPSIGTLFSKFQYNDEVSSSRGTKSNTKSADPRALPLYFSEELGFKPITIIRYKVQAGATIYNPRKLNNSPLHLYSTLLVSEMTKRFRQEIENEKMLPWSLGVLSPYRAQANIMGKLIDAHPNTSNALSIVTDTVHGFQGDQNNMVIAVFNPSSTNAAYSRFLKASYIINVAISRAEDYLVLLIPDKETNGINNLSLITQLLNIIYTLPQDQWTELSAGEIEQKLMNQQHYFEERTFTTSHQDVNVYLKPQLPYVIRMADNAVDIHLER